LAVVVPTGDRVELSTDVERASGGGEQNGAGAGGKGDWLEDTININADRGAAVARSDSAMVPVVVRNLSPTLQTASIERSPSAVGARRQRPPICAGAKRLAPIRCMVWPVESFWLREVRRR
jgi:hypothetical protein